MRLLSLNDNTYKNLNFSNWTIDNKHINNISILFNRYLFIQKYNLCLKINDVNKLDYIKSKIYSKDELKKISNKGQFGKIILNKKKNLVIKQILKEDTLFEIEILKKINHVFIISMIDYFENYTHSFIVLEYFKKGDLGELLKYNKLEIEDVIIYIGEIICAIEYLHLQDIIYMDLKPDNIMIQNDGHIKLIDFGLSIFTYKISNIGGTPVYMSPEVLKYLVYNTDKYLIDEQADIWCIGILLFELICNDTPDITDKKKDKELIRIYKKEFWWVNKLFSEDQLRNRNRNRNQDIQNRDFGFGSQDFGDQTYGFGDQDFRDQNQNQDFGDQNQDFGDVIDLLSILLKYYPDERASIDEIKDHIFFKKISWNLLPNKFYKVKIF